MRKVVKTFTEHGISMPDDAREVIFPQGVPVSQTKEYVQPAHREAAESSAERRTTDPETEDVSSENDTIRRQAAQARDPDAGQNIL